MDATLSAVNVLELAHAPSGAFCAKLLADQGAETIKLEPPGWGDPARHEPPFLGGESAYFLGANDPYGALKTTLKAEIDEEAWATLHSDTSRPFDKPKSGRIAVKVINHLGDEVMKVFRVA